MQDGVQGIRAQERNVGGGTSARLGWGEQGGDESLKEQLEENPVKGLLAFIPPISLSGVTPMI